MDELVESPCIENCCLNNEKICLGCFRSLDEISQWQQMNDRTRQNVLLKAEQRRSAHEMKRGFYVKN
jgi:predicted Fe-S protein YdhL (DUF1289 family)